MEEQTMYDNKEWEVSSAQIAKAHGYNDGTRNGSKAYQEAHLAKELASEILKLSKHTLFINLRFLEAAFVRIIPEHDLDTLEIATDGRFLYYNSLHVCRQFKKAKELPARDYLHVIFHCLFRHLFVGKKVIPQLWDLACDIAVENSINELHLKSLSCERETSQAWLIRDIKEKIPKLTAEWIYKYFEEQDLPDAQILHLQTYFHADDHSVWHRNMELEKGNGEEDENDTGTPDGDTRTETDSHGGLAEDIASEEDGKQDFGSPKEELLTAENDKDGDGGGSSQDHGIDNGQPAHSFQELEQTWKDIAERIQVDLDTFSDTYGEGIGNMQQVLKEINREKQDYTKLLQRFAVMGENLEINDDEFDYIFYTYGMKLYENMPLVEPLEYREVKKVRDFVIALDTSESVSGNTVQKFVEKTWNIIKQSENFFTRINIHIIQCGARIEEDVKITTQEEFDEYIKHMVLKGFGGTDFRPVFEHIDMLIRQHEFQNLKGLIYFTDGFGSFPSSPPAYDAAFVFLDQGYELPEVPVWAIKMIIKEDEIINF